MLTGKLSGCVIGFIALVMLCLYTDAHSYDFDGEKLEYRLYWTVFHVADAYSRVFRIDDRIYRFEGNVKTSGIASWFKKISDSGYSVWDSERCVPLKTYLYQKEGDYERKKLYFYDFDNMTVTFIKKKPDGSSEKRINSIRFMPFQDMVSAIYYFRKYGKFVVGEETRFYVCINGKFFEASIRVVAKEDIDTPFGRIKAFKCIPSRELNISGAFERRGDVYVWFTDDERHLPVKFYGKVRIGSISAVLVSARGKGFKLKRREDTGFEKIKEKFLRGYIQ